MDATRIGVCMNTFIEHDLSIQATDDQNIVYDYLPRKIFCPLFNNLYDS